MSLIVSANVQIGITSTETLSFGGVTQNIPIPVSGNFSFTNGTGSGQIAEHWELTGVTLAAGASVTYTLSALTDTLGRTIALAKAHALEIAVTSRTAGDHVTVGDPTSSLSHAWSAPFGGTATGQVTVYDALVLVATQTDGWAVVASTTDQLLIKNNGSNPITFSIALIGI